MATIRRSREAVPYRHVTFLQGNDVLDNIDATAGNDLEVLLARLTPAVVVNCVGLIKQHPDLSDPARAIATNALLPHRLAACARGWGGRVIHVSTDCVFSGTQGGYREADTPDATDLYGRTKILGEITTGGALTLRTSFIGRELSGRTSLLEWTLAQRGGSVRGFTRAVFSGVTTNALATTVCDIIEHHPALAGLYHVAAAPISKHELLCRLNVVYGLGLDVVPDGDVRYDRSLDGRAFCAATGIMIPPWADLLDELRADPTPYDTWR
jgi:dTDP-4-dehydrorhamnose reductase